MKKLSIIAITFLVFTGLAAAQNTDTFEDGNYDEAPEWSPVGGQQEDIQVTDSRAADGNYSLQITGSGSKDSYENLAWNGTDGVTELSYDIYTPTGTSGFPVGIYLTDEPSDYFLGNALSANLQTSSGDNSLTIRNNNNGEENVNVDSIPEGEWVTIQLNMYKEAGSASATAYDSQGNLITQTGNITVDYSVSRPHQSIIHDADDGTTASYFDNIEFTGDLPPSATTNSASNLGAFSATLNGQSDFGTYNGVEAYFRYRKQGDSSWTQTSKQQLNSEGSYSDTISGLESQVTYEYQAVVENGSVVNGSTTTFTTEDIDGSFLTVELGGVTDEIRIDASVYEPNKSSLNVTVDGGDEYSLSDGENIIEPDNTIQNYTLLFEWEGDSGDVQSPRVNSVKAIDYQKIVGEQARFIGYSAVALIMLFTVFRIYGMSVRAFD